MIGQMEEGYQNAQNQLIIKDRQALTLYKHVHAAIYQFTMACIMYVAMTTPQWKDQNDWI